MKANKIIRKSCRLLVAAALILTASMNVRAAAIVNPNVRLDVNGGDPLGITAKAVAVGETYGELPVPTRAKHTFIGWCTTEDGTGLLIKEDTVCQTEDEHILYAIWLTKKGAVAKPKPQLELRQGKVRERTDGRLKLRYQRVSKANGYKIQFGTNKKFKKDTYETLTVSKNDNIIFIYGIPPYKTYYVRVKAYRKTATGKRWGKWSKVKKFTSTIR